MSSELICLRTFVQRFEAEMAKSILDCHGIPAMVSAEDQAGLTPHLLIGSGGARLIVRAEDAKTAGEILDNDPVDVTELAEQSEEWDVEPEPGGPQV